MPISEADIMKVRIELEALITEREGMIAKNTQREHLGYSMAYWEDSFAILASKIRELEEKCR
jgi:hypothetical protein